LREKKLCYSSPVRNGEIERKKFPANLQPQSFPEAKNEFLRCQLGKRVLETRRMLVRSTGGHTIEHTIPVILFHLIAYGRTWEEATQMALERLGLAPPVSEPSISQIFGCN
jgi:hypothetical protein